VRTRVILPPQLSVAVGSVQENTAPHCPASIGKLWFAGQPLITGASPSVTVTVKEVAGSLAGEGEGR
jgi:hypothetical protein